MRSKLVLLAILLGGCAAARGPSVLPLALVGEWASTGAEFNRLGGLSKGEAIYLTREGDAGFIGAPPPIGSKARAMYDRTTRLLTLTVTDDGHDGFKCRYAYNPATGTLQSSNPECGNSPFLKRSESVPDDVIEEIR